MSSLKVILESHPIKNLNGIIKKIKEGLTFEKQNLLSLSKDKKRHSKATLIQHILKLDKMGLLKERPSMYDKPVRAKKVKVEVKAKPKIKVDLEKAKKAGIKVDLSKVEVTKSKGKRKPAGLIALESIDLEAEEAKDKAKSKKAKAKKPRSEKQKANDKRLGEAAKARAAAKKK